MTRAVRRAVRRALGRAAALLLAAAVAGGAFLPGASAGAETLSGAGSTPQILVSADGVNYSTTLGVNLFEGLGLLVPTEAMSTTFWVQNPTDSSIAVRLSAIDVDVQSADFAATVAIASSTSTHSSTSTDRDGQTRPLSTLASCDVLIESTLLGGGEAMAMTLTISMADVSGRVGQDESASLNLLVGMRDAAAGPFSASGCDDVGLMVGADPADAAPHPAASASDSLPQTGFEAAAPLLAVGGLIAGGLFFFMGGRRRRHVAGR